MTIRHIFSGDILGQENTRDVIIGMNDALEDVRGIGKAFVHSVSLRARIALGSVLTFEDGNRLLHMLICHKIGTGGWQDADKYVRYGLDHLDHVHGHRRTFSIVQIGTGRVGRRDGADEAAIRTAMATSFLDVALYIYPQQREAVAAEQRLRVVTDSVPMYHWSPNMGVDDEIRVAA